MTKQWYLPAIQTYIDNEVEENIHLANASGGTILYDMKESADPAKKHLVATIDPINRSVITKEWLEQVKIGLVNDLVIENSEMNWTVHADNAEPINV